MHTRQYQIVMNYLKQSLWCSPLLANQWLVKIIESVLLFLREILRNAHHVALLWEQMVLLKSKSLADFFQTSEMQNQQLCLICRNLFREKPICHMLIYFQPYKNHSRNEHGRNPSLSRTVEGRTKTHILCLGPLDCRVIKCHQ